MKNIVLISFAFFISINILIAQRTGFSNQMYPATIQDNWEANRVDGISELAVWEFKYFFKKLSKDSSLSIITKYDTCGLEKSSISYRYKGNGWCKSEYEIKDSRIIKSTRTCSFWKKDYSPESLYYYNSQGKLEYIVSNSKYKSNDTTTQYFYYKSGLLASQSYRSNGMYHYDDNDRFIGFFYGDEPSYLLEYDELGNIIRENIGGYDGHYMNIIEYEYDDENRKISSTISEYDEESSTYKKGENCKYTYEGEKVKTKTCVNTEYLKDEIIEYEYNSSGELTTLIEKNIKGKPKRMLKYYRK